MPYHGCKRTQARSVPKPKVSAPKLKISSLWALSGHICCLWLGNPSSKFLISSFSLPCPFLQLASGLFWALFFVILHRAIQCSSPCNIFPLVVTSKLSFPVSRTEEPLQFMLKAFGHCPNYVSLLF